MRDPEKFLRAAAFAALIAVSALAQPFAAGAHDLKGQRDAGDHFTAAPAPKTVAMGETLYVPVYSHVYLSGRGQRPLAATLSIRNTDAKEPIFITAVRYYGTAGKLVQAYLEPANTHLLAPFSSTDFVVDQVDLRGGAGAHFIVEWVAPKKVARPLVEAIMIGITGSQGLSFVGQSRVLKTLP